MTSTDAHHARRVAAYRSASAALGGMGEDALRSLLDGAVPVGAGIGGQTLRVQVDGVPVFVKRLRLTDLERRPEHRRSSANLFGLPLFSHLGLGTIGGPGFGAWRELSVHLMTTEWVLTGEHDGFPLTYHWRVLPDDGLPLPVELADVDRAVDYWGGDTAIRRRIEAVRDATASVVLFLEHLPQTLHDWLGAQVRAGDEAVERACAMVDSGLRDVVAFMNGRGLLHLDCHFWNVLTDGRRLYVADYGLAVSDRFALDPAEAEFVSSHGGYDRCYTAWTLVNWLVVALLGCGADERRELVRSWAAGVTPEGVPAAVAALVARDAPLAAAMGDFCLRFRFDGRREPFPSEELRRLDAARRLPARAGD
ncbi:hypothetical protein ATJ88_1324 [Isoptericola jiangsuensis]|uniref:Protein kinase domain-containing protein n=1 Tax=Isoptericola jiangsuensis TaxID=548579 RepID=A0A2A9EVR0_9MICO|nr:hypothetical protein [Isoptericola jiangsuensis]PFG42656.1 hypothetical protein ATJ88_1324 [Isoptericola jiangsuensis]